MDPAHTDVLSCPFCDFSDSDTYFLTQHVELCHPENGFSPFIAAEEESSQTHITGPDEPHQSSRGDSPQLPSLSYTPNESAFIDGYVECPHGCGEVITNAELQLHLDLHVAEGFAFEEVNASTKATGQNDAFGDDVLFDDEEAEFASILPKGDRDDILQSKHPRKGSDRDIPSSRRSKKSKKGQSHGVGGSVRRLGRSELGPYAHEKQMPAWLWRLLEDGSKVTWTNQIQPDGKLHKVAVVANETDRVIPVLRQLCDQDDSVDQAYFCSPLVKHVFKLPKEGGFCGYRNTQMMISYIQASGAQGCDHFPGRLPSILKLQDMIEDAWDAGFNPTAKIETGGIRGTRKYIGTSEAQALFQYLGIRCEPFAFNSTPELSANEALRISILDYFRQGSSAEGQAKKAIQTELPPIYFQHHGHSMTIVGFEIRKNGSGNLLVFDPMFKASPGIERLIDTKVNSTNPARLLRAYRRGADYLRKYPEFEILK
ncbi:hypothetical protein AJ80_09439 [Polytolypa hystricis UAMH7299]|uniref:UFSP1/2/DUB catalytic domain-containing protein n=1 Tax=Polytolypa hystricis (strain UAMH7299) TaxID=1447883 RepID=A0A2B7WQM1_POLH7|nr:hypothetical protein AJ80_09439 [Polytolypa hystricis UAMH7299]